MKKNIIKYFIGTNFLVLAFLVYSLISCNDSGVIPPSYRSGRFVVTESGLAPLVDSVNGLYQLWLLQDSSGVTLYYHISTFNIAWVQGKWSFVDANGNNATFNYTGDTTKLNRSTQLLLTVEPGTGGPVPGPLHLISDTVFHSQDTLSGNLTIGGNLAFGNVGVQLMLGTGAEYTLQTPSSPNPGDCWKGLWFCDGSGAALLPPNIGLNANSPWVYEGWVADSSNQNYYPMGRFYDPYSADMDGAGPCAGPNPGWNKPGQDWIQNGCPAGKPQITDLHVGYHQVFITLEPANEVPGTYAYNTPFFFKVFWQPHIAGGCDQKDPYFVSQYKSFPTMHVTIQL